MGGSLNLALEICGWANRDLFDMLTRVVDMRRRTTPAVVILIHVHRPNNRLLQV